MNKEEANKYINDEVEKVRIYCKLHCITEDEYFIRERKKKIAIEKKERDKLRENTLKLLQRPIKYEKKVFDWDIQDEIWQERYKRERENYIY